MESEAYYKMGKYEKLVQVRLLVSLLLNLSKTQKQCSILLPTCSKCEVIGFSILCLGKLSFRARFKLGQLLGADFTGLLQLCFAKIKIVWFEKKTCAGHDQRIDVYVQCLNRLNVHPELVCQLEADSP